jgi:hypothetical protein
MPDAVCDVTSWDRAAVTRIVVGVPPDLATWWVCRRHLGQVSLGLTSEVPTTVRKL